MSLRGLDDRVYIIPMEDRDKIGSLYVPEAGKQRVDQGIVKYRGPNTNEVKVGDHVIFSGYTGDTIVIEGEGELFVMPESFILAIIEDDVEHHMFTHEQLASWIERAAGDAVVAGHDPEAVDNIAKRLRQRLDDHIFNSMYF